MEIKRSPFQGVLNILRFNRHFYGLGLFVFTLIVGSFWIVQWSSNLFLFILLVLGYGLFIPLIVSYYIYDLSGFYQFYWLKKIQLNDHSARLHVNIHAGFDETSFQLKELFPQAMLTVFDFYNEKLHTEPAIVRARKVSLVFPNTQQINTSSIPLTDASVDTIFLIFAAHEIRSFEEKVTFLKECRRVVNSGGNVVMVEHLRDLPNFLAFSVGFTHFYSRNTWLKAFRKAGFTSILETKHTPFISIFNCHS
ncbi:MAG: class I SAM-dependent methyltransferase [Flavobacteriales bacterium]